MLDINLKLEISLNAGHWQTLRHTSGRTAWKSLRFIIIIFPIGCHHHHIHGWKMMLATVQGVSHVFDTLAGVEAAQLQTVLVQAEEVLFSQYYFFKLEHSR